MKQLERELFIALRQVHAEINTQFKTIAFQGSKALLDEIIKIIGDKPYNLLGAH